MAGLGILDFTALGLRSIGFFGFQDVFGSRISRVDRALRARLDPQQGFCVFFCPFLHERVYGVQGRPVVQYGVVSSVVQTLVDTVVGVWFLGLALKGRVPESRGLAAWGFRAQGCRRLRIEYQ